MAVAGDSYISPEQLARRRIDESLEDTDNLPPPGVIAAEIVEDLQAALAEFTELAESLQAIGVEVESDD